MGDPGDQRIFTWTSVKISPGAGSKKIRPRNLFRGRSSGGCGSCLGWLSSGRSRRRSVGSSPGNQCSRYRFGCSLLRSVPRGSPGPVRSGGGRPGRDLVTLTAVFYCAGSGGSSADHRNTHPLVTVQPPASERSPAVSLQRSSDARFDRSGGARCHSSESLAGYRKSQQTETQQVDSGRVQPLMRSSNPVLWPHLEQTAHANTAGSCIHVPSSVILRQFSVPCPIDMKSGPRDVA